MKLTGMLHISAAIVYALEHEIERARTPTPLRERISALRDHARAKASLAPTTFSDAERDGCGSVIRSGRADPVFIGTSAVIAILVGDQEGDAYPDAIEGARHR
jgi:hypothetical protein